MPNKRAVMLTDAQIELARNCIFAHLDLPLALSVYCALKAALEHLGGITDEMVERAYVAAAGLKLISNKPLSLEDERHDAQAIRVVLEAALCVPNEGTEV